MRASRLNNTFGKPGSAAFMAARSVAMNIIFYVMQNTPQALKPSRRSLISCCLCIHFDAYQKQRRFDMRQRFTESLLWSAPPATMWLS